MSRKKLAEIIANLQVSVARGGMTSTTVTTAIKELSSIGYEYDYDAFPKLENTEVFADESGDSPRNLAEALLWKLGKWKSYKKFARQYSEEDSKPTDTDVVFFAFAKHLKNPDNPIYDQLRIPDESGRDSGGKAATVPAGKRPAFRFDCSHHSGAIRPV